MDDWDNDDEMFVMPGADFRDTIEKARQRPHNVPVTDHWRALIAGKTIGKRVNVAVLGVSPEVGGTSLPRTPPTNLFEIGSVDEQALTLTVTLSQPRLIPADKFPGGVIPTNPLELADATGERTNASYAADVPATIDWLPGVAFLEWGIGGVQNSAEIDWVNGATLNITASWVRISAFVDAVHGGFGGSLTNSVLSLTAFVGPGTIDKGTSAQRTMQIGTILPGPANPATNAGYPTRGFGPNQSLYSPRIYPVPSMAKFVTLVGIDYGASSDVAGADWSLLVLFFTSLGGSAVAAVRFTNASFGQAPIPSMARWFTIQNDAATVIEQVSAVFQLSI